ncbi:MAG: DUF4350 domain-containing protein [Acidimicrobiia bacterium]
MTFTSARRAPATRSSVRSQWRGIRTVWKAIILVTLALTVLVTAFLFLGNLAPSKPAPNGSTFATSTLGYRGWYLLLNSYGWRTNRIQGPLDESALNPAHTLVIADDRAELDEGERAAVTSFVERGGRLVAISNGQDWLREITGVPLTWRPEGETEVRPLALTSLTAGVVTVQQQGFGSWDTLPQGVRPILGTANRTVVVEVTRARGTVIAVADGSLVSNSQLVNTDNALFSLRLAGDDRTVDFAEGIHGFDRTKRKGLNAIPVPWRLAGLGIVFAGIVFLVAKARRLGPPETHAPMLSPSRQRYIEAYATSLAAARDPGASGANVQRVIRRIAAQRTGIQTEYSDDLFRSAAIRIGLNEAEIQVVTRPIRTEADLVTATRVLARLTETRSTQ